MDNALVLLLQYAMIIAASSYNDYAVSPMPDYDRDYKNPDAISAPNAYVDKSLQVGPSLDYNYDEESDDRKSDRGYIDYTIKNKRLSPKVMIDDDDNFDDEPPIKKPRIRTEKPQRRNRLKYESDSDSKNIKHSRNRNKINTALESYAISEEEDRDNYKKEAERYSIREIMNTQARRKPRDRPINIILHDGGEIENKIDKAPKEKYNNEQKSQVELGEYEYDDMKRVDSLKKNLPNLMRSKVSLTETPSTRLSEEQRNRRVHNLDDILKVSVSSKNPELSMTIPSTLLLQFAASNKGNLSLAERSRLSILRKLQKKESLNVTVTTKPPVLMQVTDGMQTVVMVESQKERDSNSRVRLVVDDSPERIDRAKKLMRQKLVADTKDIRDLTDNWDEMICDYIDVSLLSDGTVLSYDEETTTVPALIAARELGALLGHRQRKEITRQSLNPSSQLPTTFPPSAVGINMDTEWNHFIKINRARRLNCTIYVTLLATLNYLKCYKRIFCECGSRNIMEKASDIYL